MKKSDAKLISRSLDGLVRPAERVRVERLLMEDTEAARAAQAWQDIGDRLRMDAARTPAPDPLVAWQEIRREIRKGAPDRRDHAVESGAHLFRWVTALAAVVVVSLIGWSVIRFQRPAPPAAPSSHATQDRVDWVVAEVPGATTMIYTDTETDMTVIWMDLAETANPRDS